MIRSGSVVKKHAEASIAVEISMVVVEVVQPGKVAHDHLLIVSILERESKETGVIQLFFVWLRQTISWGHVWLVLRRR